MYLGILTRWAAEEELHLGSSRAVADTNSTGKGNEVAGCDTMLSDEGLLNRNSLIETNVGMVLGLNIGESHDRAVSASATEKHI